MANSTDAAFEAWLAALPNLGYPPDWIRHNIPILRKRFERGDQLPPCGPPPAWPRDRYEEI